MRGSSSISGSLGTSSVFPLASCVGEEESRLSRKSMTALCRVRLWDRLRSSLISIKLSLELDRELMRSVLVAEEMAAMGEGLEDREEVAEVEADDDVEAVVEGDPAVAAFFCCDRAADSEEDEETSGESARGVEVEESTEEDDDDDEGEGEGEGGERGGKEEVIRLEIVFISVPMVRWRLMSAVRANEKKSSE